jgi:uncharacterized protein YodC (DUF2158 family)
MTKGIRVGDQVQLKTGGPIMTVHRLWAERGLMMARCSRVESGKHQGGSVAITLPKHPDE